MHCDLLLSGLLPPLTADNEGRLPYPDLSALETLLARGRREPVPAETPEGWLCRIFGAAKQHDWPVAPLTLLADGGDPGCGYWLRADPAHLMLRRDRMILAGGDALAISPSEAELLVEALNRHFSAAGLVFHVPHPRRWYLGPIEQAGIHTTPLPEAAGRNVRGLLPRGPDEKRWHGILNEIQMLLHSHPVNEAREARDEPSINSVWLWGGGKPPDSLARPFDSIASDEPLARGLALAAGISGAALPASADAWLDSAPAGRSLVVLDAPRSAAQYGDLTAWEESLKALERNWFEPLRQAVRAGRLTLVLHVPEAGACWRIDRAELWKFWRGAKPLAELLANPC